MRISATNFPAVLCVHYNNMYTIRAYIYNIYNGQSGDINNANSGGSITSRSNLAEDVVKVYIVLRCIYTLYTYTSSPG
jgi:hypothetical protein